MAMGDFEVYAAHLLLTAPTDLVKRWAETSTATDGNLVIQEELNYFNFSPPVRDFVAKVAQKHWAARNVFRGVGQAVGATMYSGSEPHPTREQVTAMIDALRLLEK